MMQEWAMVVKPAKAGEVFVGRLAHGDDLLDSLTAFCASKKITLAWVQALGAVQKARVGYYDQNNKKYEFIDYDRHLEILNLTGNVSVRDGKPMLHAHVTLADDRGNAFGGHLAQGTVVFACEFCVQVLDGSELVREMETQTGLPLWRA